MNNNLIWIDLEMSGLNIDTNQILEIATIATDSDLNILEDGPSFAIGYNEAPNLESDIFRMHSDSGLLNRINDVGVSLKEAEAQTLKFIMRHSKKGKSPLCGNSIWQDKLFLQKYMPTITDFLHYRVIDVSTIKVLVKEWYPNSQNNIFEKNNPHRALGDIKESIEELRHYRRYFFIES